MRRLLRWLPVVLWMGLITYWSGQSELPIDQAWIARLLRGQQHPLAHAAAFGILAMLVRWAVEGTPGATLWAFLFSVMFGAVDEWHQSFTPGRASDWKDLAVDAMAAALAVMCTDAALQIWRAWRAGRWRPASFAVPAMATVVTAAITLSLLPPHVLPTRTETQRAFDVATRALPQPAERYTRSLARTTMDAARFLRNQVRDLARLGPL